MDQIFEAIVKLTKQLQEKGVECKGISIDPAVKESDLDVSRSSTSGCGVIVRL